MRILRIGDRGDDVRDLQIQLKALSFHQGACDGIYGPVTQESVRRAQRAFPALAVDGIVGPLTRGQLEQALLVEHPPEEKPPGSTGEICSVDVWDSWLQVAQTITRTPVRYGPGRGAFVDDEMVVTFGIKPNMADNWKPGGFPSFHCSSWTNFFCGWIYRVGARYTHTGNIPPLWDVLQTEGASAYQGIPYRGYGPGPQRFEPDRPYLTSSEIWSRRAELSSFVVWAQSTRKRDGSWRWWHHTGLFTVDHRSPGLPMARLAADGYRSSAGVYSGTPMRLLPLDSSWATSDDYKHRYRLYCVEGLDKVEALPLLPVVIEEDP